MNFYGVERFGNDAESYLVNDISSSQGTLIVTDPVKFPAKGVFRIIVEEEIMLVTSRVGALLNVERGFEETEPVAHLAGALVVHVITKGAMNSAIKKDKSAYKLTYNSTDPYAISSSGSTLYALPYEGDEIDLFDPVEEIFNGVSIGEGLSIALPTNTGSGGGFNSTSVNLFDVFCYFDEATRGAKLELFPWQDASTRSSDGNLIDVEGRTLKSNQKEKRYLGTIMTVPNSLGGPGMDSPRRRYIYNHHNQVPRPVKTSFGATSYETANGLSVVGNTDNRFEFVSGWKKGYLDVELNITVDSDQAYFGNSWYTLGFGENTASVIREDTVTSPIRPYYSMMPARAVYRDVPTKLGYNYLQALQVAQNQFDVIIDGSGFTKSGFDGYYLS